MTDANAIVSYVPVGPRRLPWRALVMAVFVCAAAIYIAKSWQDPKQWIPGYRAWLAHDSGVRQARVDLGLGIAVLHYAPETTGPDMAHFDSQTGLPIQSPTCGSCIMDPVFRPYSRAYNRTVREWIAANGLPANSVRDRFRDPLTVASALDAGKTMTPGSVLTLPDGRLLAWCVGDDDMHPMSSYALTVFARDGSRVGFVESRSDTIRIACDESAVFARVRGDSGKRCDVVLDTKLKLVIQVFNERAD